MCNLLVSAQNRDIFGREYEAATLLGFVPSAMSYQVYQVRIREIQIASDAGNISNVRGHCTRQGSLTLDSVFGVAVLIGRSFGFLRLARSGLASKIDRRLGRPTADCASGARGRRWRQRHRPVAQGS